MTTETHQRALSVVFGLVVTCAALSVWGWFASGLGVLGAICCHHFELVPAESWMTLLTLSGIATLIIYSTGTLVIRLRRTRQFAARLNSVPVAVPAPDLVRLFAKLGLSRHVVMLATDSPLAFCIGLMHPRIYISTGLIQTLTVRELKAVLIHEDQHRRQRDPLRGLLTEVAGATLFFLPIAAELRDRMMMSFELQADRRAVRLVGRPALAGALHKILTHPLAQRLPLAIGANGLAATERRIAYLLGEAPAQQRLSPWALLSSSAILAGLCMLIQFPMP